MNALLGLVLSLAAATAPAAEIASDERRSGYDFAGPDIRAMQDDDTVNPGMLWVLQGEVLWAEQVGAAGRSCADCHGDARNSMKGVAARYPPRSTRHLLARSISSRGSTIAAARIRVRSRSPGKARICSRLTAFVARQSRGLPIAVSTGPESRPFLDLGKELFRQREGQLNLSCSQCHDDNWGKRLAGSVIPQGHPTGYPI